MSRTNRFSRTCTGLVLAAITSLSSCALIYHYDDLSYGTGGSSTSGSSGTGCEAGGGSPGLGEAQWSDGFVAVPTGATAADGGPTGAYLSMLGIAVDRADETIVLGTFVGDVTMGTSTFTTGGNEYGLLLAKLDPAGKVKWARRIGNGSIDGDNPYAGSVAADADGNIVLAVTFSGTLSIDATHTYTNSNYGDVFLAKLDPDGNLLWGQHNPNLNSQLVTDVAVDESGTIAITGFFNGTLLFSPCAQIVGPPGGPGQGFNVFTAVFEGDGTCRWARSFGGEQAANTLFPREFGLRVTVRGDTVVAGGALHHDLTFDATHTLTAADPDAGPGIADNFVVALEGATGNIRFAKDLGQGDGLVNVAVNETGEILLAFGATQGLVPFDAKLTPLGGTDVGLMKLAADGKVVWARLFGGAAQDHAQSMALDPFGHLLLTGSFQGSVLFGSDTLDCQGDTNVFFVKLDQEGKPLASGRFGDASALGLGIRSSPCGATVLAGSYAGKLHFGQDPLPLPVGGGTFVTRFSR
ncbi:MAG: hypothetical protein ABJE95_04060 [Byssovorax sp.]